MKNHKTEFFSPNLLDNAALFPNASIVTLNHIFDCSLDTYAEITTQEIIFSFDSDKTFDALWLKIASDAPISYQLRDSAHTDIVSHTTADTHILHKFAPQTKSTVKFRITSAPTVRLYRIMLMKSLLILDDGTWTKIEATPTKRTRGVLELLDGTLRTYEGFGHHAKMEWHLATRFFASDPDPDDYLSKPDPKLDTLFDIYNNYPEFIFSQEADRYPERVRPALFAGPIRTNYSGRWKKAGYSFSLNIRER